MPLMKGIQMEDKNSPEYEVCLCKHTTRAEVEKFIRENNIKTLKELCEKGKFGTVCGGCREDLEMILEEVKKSLS